MRQAARCAAKRARRPWILLPQNLQERNPGSAQSKTAPALRLGRTEACALPQLAGMAVFFGAQVSVWRRHDANPQSFLRMPEAR